MGTEPPSPTSSTLPSSESSGTNVFHWEPVQLCPETLEPIHSHLRKCRRNPSHFLQWLFIAAGPMDTGKGKQRPREQGISLHGFKNWIVPFLQRSFQRFSVMWQLQNSFVGIAREEIHLYLKTGNYFRNLISENLCMHLFFEISKKKKEKKDESSWKNKNKSNPTQPKRWFGQIFGPVNRVSALFPSDVIVLKWLFSWAPYHLKELEAFEKWAINLGLGREELPRLCCRRLPRLLA